MDKFARDLYGASARRYSIFLDTDIVMPGLDGVEVARRARVSQPGLRVTFITGFGEGASRVRNLAIDGMRVLSNLPVNLNPMRRSDLSVARCLWRS